MKWIIGKVVFWIFSSILVLFCSVLFGLFGGGLVWPVTGLFLGDAAGLVIGGIVMIFVTALAYVGMRKDWNSNNSSSNEYEPRLSVL